ncbi:MAG: ABC transporter substrate-binding protein [Acetanaerobacterium sp.]
MKSIKITALAMAVLMVMALAAGCATTPAVSEEPAAPAAEEPSSEAPGMSGNIKVLTHRTDRMEDGSLEEMTKAFTDKYGITVEYQGFTDYATEVPTVMQAGNYGDVLMTPQSVKQAELPQFFAELGDAATISEKYMWTEDFTTDGKVYALPHAGTASGIMYNKQVWADAGITALPTSTDEFLACLKQIAENTEAIPYYTNYAAGWTITQWQSLIVSCAGDPDYTNNCVTGDFDLFEEGGPYDLVYGMLYNIYADPSLTEEDHSTTDWEGCKPAFGEGKIGAMVMGSWAIAQFQETAADPAVVGYMPFPNQVGGKQYAQTAHDYGISANKDSTNMDAAIAYVTWFVDESGFAQKEGMLSAVKGAAMPDTLSAFEELGVELFSETPAPEKYVGVYDKIAKELSTVDPWGDASDNFKFKLAEKAFAGEGDAGYKEVADAATAAWNEARTAALAEIG